MNPKGRSTTLTRIPLQFILARCRISFTGWSYLRARRRNSARETVNSWVTRRGRMTPKVSVSNNDQIRTPALWEPIHLTIRSDFLGQLIRLQVYLEMQEFKRDRDTLNSLNNLPKVNPPCAIDAEANVVEPSASDSYLARSVAPEERDGTRQRLRAVAGDADDLHGAPRLLHPSIMAIITEVVYAAYNILPPR